jgi:hypothetical protein
MSDCLGTSAQEYFPAHSVFEANSTGMRELAQMYPIDGGPEKFRDLLGVNLDGTE